MAVMRAGLMRMLFEGTDVAEAGTGELFNHERDMLSWSAVR